MKPKILRALQFGCSICNFGERVGVRMKPELRTELFGDEIEL